MLYIEPNLGSFLMVVCGNEQIKNMRFKIIYKLNTLLLSYFCLSTFPIFLYSFAILNRKSHSSLFPNFACNHPSHGKDNLVNVTTMKCAV